MKLKICIIKGEQVSFDKNALFLLVIYFLALCQRKVELKALQQAFVANQQQPAAAAAKNIPVANSDFSLPWEDHYNDGRDVIQKLFNGLPENLPPEGLLQTFITHITHSCVPAGKKTAELSKQFNAILSEALAEAFVVSENKEEFRCFEEWSHLVQPLAFQSLEVVVFIRELWQKKILTNYVDPRIWLYFSGLEDSRVQALILNKVLSVTEAKDYFTYENAGLFYLLEGCDVKTWNFPLTDAERARLKDFFALCHQQDQLSNLTNKEAVWFFQNDPFINPFLKKPMETKEEDAVKVVLVEETKNDSADNASAKEIKQENENAEVVSLAEYPFLQFIMATAGYRNSYRALEESYFDMRFQKKLASDIAIASEGDQKASYRMSPNAVLCLKAPIRDFLLSREVIDLLKAHANEISDLMDVAKSIAEGTLNKRLELIKIKFLCWVQRDGHDSESDKLELSEEALLFLDSQHGKIKNPSQFEDARQVAKLIYCAVLRFKDSKLHWETEELPWQTIELPLPHAVKMAEGISEQEVPRIAFISRVNNYAKVQKLIAEGYLQEDQISDDYYLQVPASNNALQVSCSKKIATMLSEHMQGKTSGRSRFEDKLRNLGLGKALQYAKQDLNLQLLTQVQGGNWKVQGLLGGTPLEVKSDDPQVAATSKRVPGGMFQMCKNIREAEAHQDLTERLLAHEKAFEDNAKFASEAVARKSDDRDPEVQKIYEQWASQYVPSAPSPQKEDRCVIC